MSPAEPSLAPSRRLGFRSRLLVASTTLLALYGIVAGLWLNLRYHPHIEAETARSLMGHARVAARLVDDTASVVQLAGEVGARVVIVRPDGTARADSDPGAPIPTAPAALPWVGHAGTLMAAGVPLSDGSSVWVTRPHRDVVAPAVMVGRLLFGAGVAGLIVSLGMTLFAFRLMVRDLRLLLDHTTSIAQGDPAPVQQTAVLEFAEIAGSVRNLTNAIDGVVRDLYNERRRFETVLGGMSEAVLALDGEGHITLVNPAGQELFGFGRDWYGEPLLEVLRVPALAEASEVGLRGDATTTEFDLRRGGKPRRLHVVATPLETGGLVMVLHDYTEVRRLERIRKDFVANVSHELRTPVAILQASVEALEDGAIEDPTYAMDFLEAISRNAARLAHLIDDLLKISRIEEGRLQLERTPLYVRDLVDQVVVVLGPRLGARRDHLRLEVSAEHAVMSDPSALEQVLVNLLENAVKYTPAGTPITIRSQDTAAGRVRLEVADQGEGIAAHHRERIFERFYRVDPGRARNVGGTGLGLAIVKHLVDAMGGEVGVASNTPRGSVFWVELPAPGPPRLGTEEETVEGPVVIA